MGPCIWLLEYSRQSIIVRENNAENFPFFVRGEQWIILTLRNNKQLVLLHDAFVDFRRKFQHILTAAFPEGILEIYPVRSFFNDGKCIFVVEKVICLDKQVTFVLDPVHDNDRRKYWAQRVNGPVSMPVGVPSCLGKILEVVVDLSDVLEKEKGVVGHFKGKLVTVDRVVSVDFAGWQQKYHDKEDEKTVLHHFR
jgi:hypothetical protein